MKLFRLPIFLASLSLLLTSCASTTPEQAAERDRRAIEKYERQRQAQEDFH